MAEINKAEFLRKCSICSLEKPLSEFYTINRSKDGLVYHITKCKDCFKSIMNNRNKLKHTNIRGRPRKIPLKTQEEINQDKLAKKKIRDANSAIKIRERLLKNYNVSAPMDMLIEDLRKLSIKTIKLADNRIRQKIKVANRDAEN